MTYRVLRFLAATAGVVVIIAPGLFLWYTRRANVPGERPAGRTNLLRIGGVPAVSVESSATVMDAVKVMQKEGVGAVLVIDGDELKGIFTERDLMLRVALRKKDSKATALRDVMTSPVTTTSRSSAPDDALKMMLSRRIRHLPIVDSSGRVDGMLSIRHLLSDQVENLEIELDSLAAYLCADGIGG